MDRKYKIGIGTQEGPELASKHLLDTSCGHCPVNHSTPIFVVTVVVVVLNPSGTLLEIIRVERETLIGLF